MKYRILIMLFWLVACVVNAQPKYEIRAGYTRYEQLPLNKSYSVGGFLGGVVLDFKTNEKLSFQPGLLFVMKGTKPILYVNNLEIVERLSYLEVPLMLSWKIPIETSRLFFDWGAGLYCAHGLTGTIKEKEIDGTWMSITEYSAFHYRKRFDTGLQAGIGIGGSRFRLGMEGQVSVTSSKLAGLRFFYGYKF